MVEKVLLSIGISVPGEPPSYLSNRRGHGQNFRVVTSMTFSDNARKTLTEAFEGCKLAAYRDSKGVLTIGYGHTSHVYAGQTCTQADADRWLVQDIATAEAAVNRLVTVTLSQHEFDALVDFTFNVGVGNFANSTLLHDIDSNNIAGAAAEFAKWDYCGGVILQGLVRRRLAEAQYFNTPD